MEDNKGFKISQYACAVLLIGRRRVRHLCALTFRPEAERVRIAASPLIICQW